jgi:hypothetical protein
VVGVSDAGFAAGPPDGEFTAFGIRGHRGAGGRYLAVSPPAGGPPPDPRTSDAAMLFRSAVGMREVFENALNWLSQEMEGIWRRSHPALPFPEALRDAVALTSGNPARLLGEQDRGRLVAGARADALLAVIDGPPGGYQVELKTVWVGGEVIAPPRKR